MAKPDSYTQIYIHLVFAVKNRNALLSKQIRSRVFQYMAGTLRGKQHKSYIINGVADHVHLLFGMHPNQSLSDCVRDLKRSSSLLINQNRLTPIKFQWQEGFGGFSYSKSQVPIIYNYIDNQEEHHRKKTFREEYTSFLKEYEENNTHRTLFDFFE